MSFLYDKLKSYFGERTIRNTEVPNYIIDNLNPRFGVRGYQQEAFQRFILCTSEDFEGKPPRPLHLLYNMATGSGKTLIMGGLMLYLYEKGYRNFLFFVNSNTIIKKTKENFLNSRASKYLFNKQIFINGKAVEVRETNSFEDLDPDALNIKFTTIQQLHLDLNNTKENSVTYEDFRDSKLILIADEAHHLNSATKGNVELFGSWEGTVIEILKQNYENMLLEFTATLDLDSAEIVNKYQDKVIFKYDLAQFRVDKYSKEINLLRSEYEERERILQALVLNLYRQELAIANKIHLKPVILFKAKKTIKESEQNKINFEQLVEDLSVEMVEAIRTTSAIPIVTKAFGFFDKNSVSSQEIVDKLKWNFRPQNCISANSDEEADRNQLLLNTLEDANNPIRAVFAVQKLNEGWDVLNLYDIVRLYEGQNTGGKNTKVGATTLSEAQLIGRGARYFPFALESGQDPFTRKYDSDQTNDIKILEELYYHTKEDSRYISELKKALVESGIYVDDDRLEVKHLKLKDEFKKTDFYKYGRVVFNRKQPRSFNNVKSIFDLGVAKHNFKYLIPSGLGKVTNVFDADEEVYPKNAGEESPEAKDLMVASIPRHVTRYALAQNPFFHFDNLKKFFPGINSLSEFIENPEYLGGLSITFVGSPISNNSYLRALQGLLQSINLEIKKNLTQYEGSMYISEYIHKVFKDQTIRVDKDDERAHGQESVVATAPWYAYNANYGTSEEKKFVALFARLFTSLDRKFQSIFLIRNERVIKIVNSRGNAFEPDFILFCKQNGTEELTYQVFIEPKGAHLIANDKWKEEFLNEIRQEGKTLKIETDTYVITGVPFYNYDNENEFKSALDSAISHHN